MHVVPRQLCCYRFKDSSNNGESCLAVSDAAHTIPYNPTMLSAQAQHPGPGADISRVIIPAPQQEAHHTEHHKDSLENVSKCCLDLDEKLLPFPSKLRIHAYSQKGSLCSGSSEGMDDLHQESILPAGTATTSTGL